MKYDIQLSKHFKLSEFIRSATAAAKGIDNTPGIEEISKLQTLCMKVLEPLREHFKCPITISSGYRCAKLNTAVGGASNSQHMSGEAADIHLPTTAIGKKWFAWLMDQDFDQLILEHSSPSKGNTTGTYWIHVSYRQDGHNRHQVIENLMKRT